jgi:lipoyl(octanoyl) transferase
MPRLNVVDAGLVEYDEMFDRQLHLFNSIIERKRDGQPVEDEYLLMVEHPHVYTIGKHGHDSNLLMAAELLAGRGIKVKHIGRGGDITYHGPGQFVAYPIIDLSAHKLGVKQYVSLLEESVIQLISEYGIKGVRVEGATGVWIDKGTPLERKICAIGIKCSRFVSMHGLALNVNTDLSYFNAINPCGFVDKGVTSISKEIGEMVDMSLVKQQFAEIFKSLLINR